MRKKIYNGLDMNNNSVYDVASIKLNRRATAESEAVPLKQMEEFVATEVNSDIVKLRIDDLIKKAIDERFIDSPKHDTDAHHTVLTTNYIQRELDKKQNELRIDPRSHGYLEIINGYIIRVKPMGMLQHGLLNEHEDSDIREVVQQIEDHLFAMQAVDRLEEKRAKEAEGRLHTKMNITMLFVAIFALWRLISVLYTLLLRGG